MSNPTGRDPFPVMEHMTVKLVREYLARKQSIIVPMGSIEQHGYHLPLKTDTLIAAGLGRRIGEKADVLVSPVIYTTFSGGGLPGTINISPAVMSLVVADTLISLVAQGFRNFYLLLCHGGSENTRALEDSIKSLLRSNPAFAEVMVVLLPVWKLCSPGSGWFKAIEEHDWHAGWLETSMIMALEPDLVRMQDFELGPAPLLDLQIAHPDNYQHAEKIVDDDLVVPRLTQRPDIKVGVMGHPERASRELGEELVEDTIAHAVAKIRELESRADGRYKEVEFVPGPLVVTQ